MVSKKTLGTIDTWKRSLLENWKLYQQSKMGIIAIIIIILFVLMALFAPYLADRDPMNYRAPDEDVYTTQGAWAKYMNATPADFQTGDYEKLTTGAVTVFSSYSPMVHVVYVGTNRGNVYSLNSIDGFPSWIKSVDNSNITAIHGENEAGIGLDPYLYVGTENGNIVKLHDSSKINTTTNHTEGYGVIAWNYSTGAMITAEPLVNQDTHTVYVANWNGDVFAIDTTLGTVKWQQNVGAPVRGDMVISADKNTLYVGTASDTEGVISAINTGNGLVMSTYNEVAPLNSGLSYDDKLNVVYYSIADTLYSRSVANVSSGALSDATTLQLSGLLTAPTVDIHTGTLYLASSDGSVLSVRSDMTIRWKNETNMGSITIAPVYSDKLDLLYIGTSTNNFITINANDGSIRILSKTVAPLSGKPLPVDAVPQEGAIKIAYQKGLFVTTRCSVELVNAAGKSALPLPPTWVKSVPSGNTYLLGTDAQGRDIWSQLVYGSRVALIVGFAAAFFSITIGVVIGLVSGYFGKAIDSVLMRLADVILVLPFLPLVIILAAVLGPSIWNIVWAITLVGWPGVARTIRAETLSLKERPYIDAARITGASHSRIMFRHIAPNVMPLAFLFATFSVSGAILTEAALSYIGLGDPTSMSWGMMLHTIQTSGAQLTAWWWLLPPGVAITLICLGFFMIGRAFDEIVNPRLRKR